MILVIQLRHSDDRAITAKAKDATSNTGVKSASFSLWFSRIGKLMVFEK
jgi:hypothetical protein